MRYMMLLVIAIVCAGGVAFSSSENNPQVAELPVPISAPHPPYPPIALAKKISGVVLVDVQVDAAEGKVVEANPLTGHEILRDIAKQAALQWRFKPFTASGGKYSVRLTFIFHDASYVAPEKKPDFTSPYQIELERPKAYY